MSTQYSVGQMNQLGDALESAGFTVEDVTKLRSYPKLRELKTLFTGCAEIVYAKHLIPCATDPFIPNNWTVEEHQKGGELEWNPDSITLYLTEKQKGGSIRGTELREELKCKGASNANVLDYLLAHPELIPEEWKGKAVFFWGTVYRYSAGNLFVRYLYWNGCRWDWFHFWLDDDWSADGPALLLASVPALNP